MDSKKRASVSLSDFLKVTVVNRMEHETATDAAEVLGMTIASFKQRLMKERKSYPDIYHNVERYKSTKGKRRPTQDEAKKLIESLMS